jgi:hypothetical protein
MVAQGIKLKGTVHKNGSITNNVLGDMCFN